MKLKEAYGHPPYNQLIKAYHSSRLQVNQLISSQFAWAKSWLADMTDCEKCQKKWRG